MEINLTDEGASEYWWTFHHFQENFLIWVPLITGWVSVPTLTQWNQLLQIVDVQDWILL